MDKSKYDSEVKLKNGIFKQYSNDEKKEKANLLYKITRSFFVITIISVLASCSSIEKNKDSSAVENEIPLVFIHGIKGGVLADKDSKKVDWITPWQGLSFDTPNLKLPLKWSDGDIPEQEKDSVVATGVLDKITLIPNIIDVKIYHGVLAEGAKKYTNFYPFGYDWRRSNLDSLEEYLTLLRKIVSKHHHPVRVIAHSMGGMLTMAAMQKEPELFDTVFFVGTPFAGGVGFLEDLHPGVPNGINNKILSPEVLASMPSVYSLFPHNSKHELSDGKNDIKIDFFSPEDWEKEKIGPFAHDFAYNKDFKEHFSKALQVAKIFRLQMFEGKLVSNGKLIAKQPKVFVILGKALPTLVQVIKNGPKSKLGWDFKTAIKEPGDGRVAARDAYPPSGIEFTEFESKAEHNEQLNDPEVLNFIFSKK